MLMAGAMIAHAASAPPNSTIAPPISGGHSPATIADAVVGF
jgi:hypothetical protein